jgi:hypothetical protein
MSLSMLSVFTAQHKLVHSETLQRPRSYSLLRDIVVSTAGDEKKAIIRASMKFPFGAAEDNVALHQR